MTPWPACVHGDDPTVCPTCWAEIEAAEAEEFAKLRPSLADRFRLLWWKIGMKLGRRPF